MQHALSRRRMPLSLPTTVHVRRSYSESRYGQLHLQTAYSAGGGFDEQVPLLCLHPVGSSSKYFEPLLPELGRDRIVYAFDLPGFGESDAPDKEWSLAEVTSVISEFTDSLRLRSFDVFGVQLGALLAIELAATKPNQVRKTVLAAVPHFTAQEAKSQEWSNLPNSPAADGSHLLKEWQRLSASGTRTSPDQLTQALVDVLAARKHNSLAQQAILDYPTAQRLAELRQQGLILCPAGEFTEHCKRAKKSYPQAQLQELPEASVNVFADHPEVVLQRVKQFLDA